MTASTLLLYICICLVGQLVLAIAFAVLRRSAPGTATAQSAKPLLAAPTAGAWSGLRAFKVVARAFEDPAKTQCSYYLAPVDGAALPAFKPGQFLTFSLEVPGSEGREAKTITRCYSLSDCPAPDQYRVTIKRVLAPTGKPALAPGVSSNYFHDDVHEGDILQLRAPSGHFHIDDLSQAPVVLIAGGIGITPMMSMLRWCVQHQPQRPVHLFYGLRNSTEHAFKADLKDLAKSAPQVQVQVHVHVHVVYSKPLATDTQPDDFQHVGHIDIELLKRSLPHGAYQFYVCGPPAMMESVVPALSQWGVATPDIHFEAFGPASVRLPETPLATQAPVEVRFARSGRTLTWNGTESNLLDFAEKHGIAVESGCRSGSCGSCLTTLVSGSVTYANLPDHEIAVGQCLLCVGKPQSALTLGA